jgi:hypothetical protein
MNVSMRAAWRTALLLCAGIEDSRPSELSRLCPAFHALVWAYQRQRVGGLRGWCALYEWERVCGVREQCVCV